ncbi:unnamed protein product [Vitrella brassicaformis CCMP3155]|uniref:Uncharacterized protein n=1 Tax=Vitrella brassicaformis (strain CCMP3155) TaxID=1169540 RepID=A0A0G4H3J7_VITBC|nr:unnamed protein product [Vitrella brassicaformis CCMP3155]|eukprot:CEM38194.1 unnamed protein product [Vitrella brassicaformis CCMP3155]
MALLIYQLICTAAAFQPPPSYSRLSGLRMSSQRADAVAEANTDRRSLVKGIAAAGVGLGLVGGKRVIDGPVYSNVVDLSGENIVITGGNTGLGKAAAVRLAALGAAVTIACRSPSKAEAAVKDIQQASGSSAVDAVPLDLTDSSSIASCARELSGRLGKIDVLMNNAGVMAIPNRETTADGYEKQMGINHLGHFRLTSLVLPLLAAASTPRVVNVSSKAHTLAKLDFSDFFLTKDYDPWVAYGNKGSLGNAAGNLRQLTAVSCHPGLVRTELGRYFFNTDNIPLFPFGWLLTPLLIPGIYASRSPERGAQTQIYCAAEPTLQGTAGGEYFEDCHISTPSKDARDRQMAARLWEVSEKLTGASWNA